VLVNTSTALLAQQVADSIVKSIAIDDVIVTGQYGENSLTNSVYKVRVIEQKRFQLQGAYNLKDVLANELNIRVSNDPSLGGSVSIQGVTGQNVKIMIDGVPVIGREGGFIDLNQLNLNNIERIEIVEGPMSVNFGTDALGGVVNLISKRQKKSGYSAGVNGYAETIGQYNLAANAGVVHNTWATDVHVARNFFEGFAINADSRKKLWKPRTQYFGDFALAKSFNKGSLKYTFGLFDEKVVDRDSAHINSFFAYGNDVYFYTRRITNSLFYNQKINKNYQLNIVASHNYYQRVRNTMRKDLVTLQETLVPSLLEHDTNYFQTWMSRGTLANNSINSKVNYQAGYELNLETGEGKRIENGMQQIADINAFGSAELKPWKNITFRPGVRFVYNTKYKAPIIPSLNLKWNVGTITTVRASYGRGFRSPSLKELHLDFVDPNHNVKGNPNLSAETQNNYQISSSFEWKKFERVFTIEPSLFYNSIDNKIDLVLENLATLEAHYNNIGRFNNVGFNTGMAYKAPNYTFIVGYALMGVNNSLMNTLGTNKYYYTNEFRSNINYEFQKIGLIASVFYKYNGRIQNYLYDINTGEIRIGFINPFSLMDITFSKSLLQKTMNVTVGSKNILDVVNVAANIPSGVHSQGGNSASIAMGRTLFISFAYTFTKDNK